MALEMVSHAGVDNRTGMVGLRAEDSLQQEAVCGKEKGAGGTAEEVKTPFGLWRDHQCQELLLRAKIAGAKLGEYSRRHD